MRTNNNNDNNNNKNNKNNKNIPIDTVKLHKARGIIKISKAVNKEKKINYPLQGYGFFTFHWYFYHLYPHPII